jgi:hypothetical protein
MAHGHYEGKGIADPSIRALFTRDALLASDWYAERLAIKQQRDMALWQRHVASMNSTASPARDALEAQLARVSSPEYLRDLQGTIGADPFHGQ